MLKIIIFLFINMLAIDGTLGASGYEYSLIEKPNQKIHKALLQLISHKAKKKQQLLEALLEIIQKS